MKFLKPSCPQCGKPIRGTVDLITGIALMREVEGQPGEYEYGGATRVDWSSQQTQDSESGLLVQGECRHTWFSHVEGKAAKPETDSSKCHLHNLEHCTVCWQNNDGPEPPPENNSAAVLLCQHLADQPYSLTPDQWASEARQALQGVATEAESATLAALRAFVATVDAAGGVQTREVVDGEEMGECLNADPDWLDLLDAYKLARAALAKRTPAENPKLSGASQCVET